MRLLVIGGSDAGISAGLRARELDPSVEVTDHKAYYPGAHPLWLRITGDRTTGRLLGAQVVGDHRAQVAKRIDIPATALFHQMTVEGLSDLDLSYTPPFGSPWDAVQMAAQAWVRQVRGGQPMQAASHEVGS
jgi:NADPH-dependent 2,4-dienoyl-CoA reductase/sulfur reductase-like enzyme